MAREAVIDIALCRRTFGVEAVVRGVVRSRNIPRVRLEGEVEEAGRPRDQGHEPERDRAQPWGTQCAEAASHLSEAPVAD